MHILKIEGLPHFLCFSLFFLSSFMVYSFIEVYNVFIIFALYNHLSFPCLPHIYISHYLPSPPITIYNPSSIYYWNPPSFIKSFLYFYLFWSVWWSDFIWGYVFQSGWKVIYLCMGNLSVDILWNKVAISLSSYY